jgi:hypothetical protein
MTTLAADAEVEADDATVMQSNQEQPASDHAVMYAGARPLWRPLIKTDDAIYSNA